MNNSIDKDTLVELIFIILFVLSISFNAYFLTTAEVQSTTIKELRAVAVSRGYGEFITDEYNNPEFKWKENN